MIHAPTELRKTLVGPIGLAISDQRFDRTAANTLDGAKSVQDRVCGRHAEMIRRLVDIRRQQVQSELPAVILERHEPIRVLQVGTHHRRHERRRVMRLQVSGLVRQDGIGSRVRLVEAVARKLLHEVKNTRRRSEGNTALSRAGS